MSSATTTFNQDTETFLLNAIHMSLLERLTLAWKLIFPSPATQKTSNARIAKQRLKMILFSDRCAVSDEAKRKIVNNIVHALSEFVEIESQDKVQLSVTTDTDLGTMYSVTVPVRRVKPEYLEFEDVGSITNIEYRETGRDGSDSLLSVAVATMSDEEHHFESKADAGASKTYPQQAGTIRKNGYIVIKNRPCKVVEVSTSKTGKHGHAKCHFVGIDIFNGKKLEDIVPSSHNCDVPHVNRVDYQLIDISEDGFVSLLTDNGNTKDDLRLPTDDALLTQIKEGFAEGKDLVVSVMSAMGEEQINALKDVGPK
ncbi:Eukaryotic translation initiation factor 5A-4 [Linum grandiflorum]